VKENNKFNPKEALLNLSSKNMFGFVMSCMQLNDWTNNHSLEDQRKAMRNHLAKLKKSSLTKRIPEKLDSSKSIPFLLAVIAVNMGEKNVYPFSIHNVKDNGL